MTQQSTRKPKNSLYASNLKLKYPRLKQSPLSALSKPKLKKDSMLKNELKCNSVESNRVESVYPFIYNVKYVYIILLGG